tara:strand:+ start:52 stop:666 length:615 start_codon:yes stop_codon:yes gene_type:complete
MSSYKFIYDTETSGLPTKERGQPYNYKDLKQFDTARLISISWLLLDEENKVVDKKTCFIKPDEFEVSPQSIKIHGLSKEFLLENGMTIHEMFLILNGIFTKNNVNVIIAHNVLFDINILKSELYRYNYNITLEKIKNIETFCTMFKSQSIMKVKKWPKLSEAYKYFYNEEITNAHDAEYDTLHCYKVYLKLYENMKDENDMDTN